MSFYLFPVSNAHLELLPDWNFDDKGAKMQSEHVTRSGKRYVYKWGEYCKFSFGVSFLNSSQAAIINSWWSTNTKLLFMENVTSAAVYSVMLTGNEKPIGNYVKPYMTLFKGKIDLQGY